jgi:hypothetical protein
MSTVGAEQMHACGAFVGYVTPYPNYCLYASAKWGFRCRNPRDLTSKVNHLLGSPAAEQNVFHAYQIAF